MSFGPIAAGTYALGSAARPDSPFSRMTATVPDGWQGIRGNTFANLFQVADDFPAGSVGLALPDNFYIDPCDITAGLMDPPVGPTVDDFVAALVAVPGYQASDRSTRPSLGTPAIRRDGCPRVGRRLQRRLRPPLADPVQRGGSVRLR